MKQYNKGCSFNQIYSIVAAMGGNAIPGVTRASPAVYEALKLQVHEAMRKHFSKVTTPKEFPEKRDYGVCIELKDNTGNECQLEIMLISLVFLF